MIEIFISYRRSESQEQALSVYEALCTLYDPKSIYLDTKNNKIGDKWREKINEHLETSLVMIVFIGPDWLNEIQKREARGIDDMVCYEVSQAIKRKNLQVFPVLVGLESMPREDDFPADLRGIHDFQAAKTTLSHEHWNEKIEDLRNEIHEKIKFIIHKSRLLDRYKTEVLRQITKYPRYEADAPLIAQYLDTKYNLAPKEISQIYNYLENFGFITMPTSKVLKLTKDGIDYLEKWQLVSKGEQNGI